MLCQLKLTPDDVNTPILIVDKSHALERRELIEEMKRYEGEERTFQNENLKLVNFQYFFIFLQKFLTPFILSHSILYCYI